jgi:polyphosphate kinase 2 (PPK2 family)
MLEVVPLKQKMSKAIFKEIFPQQRDRLRDLQKELWDAKIPLAIVFEGWDAAGKGTAINGLVKRLDPRGFKVWPISSALREEALRPFLWRFWVKTPARGRIAIFDRSWYGRVLVERLDKLCRKSEWKRAYEEIDQFERQLTDDGTVLLKFFLHISQKEQKKRFKKLQADPLLKWKVTKEDWKHHKQYDEYNAAYEEMLEKTSTHYAPWTIVPATDLRFAQVKIFDTIIAAAERALASKEIVCKSKTKTKKKKPSTKNPSILDRVDLSLSLTDKEYKKQLRNEQVRLRAFEHQVFEERRPVIVVYEGWDAAGKGGNIKRMTEFLDPRGYEVVSIAAPSKEEKAHHHLWRFWTQIPKDGHLTIFDRSWYGRVLVERIEGFCTEIEWRRAFQELNEFEAQLASHGAIIAKFWIHISKEEQLRRFEARKGDEYKNWKLTDEDWRNRQKWDDYENAVIEMLQRTSTTYAPWTVVEGNCKLWARVKALRTLNDAIEGALNNQKKKRRGR